MVKGSAANVGAENLRKVAYNIELESAENNLKKAEIHFNELRIEFEKFESFVTNSL